MYNGYWDDYYDVSHVRKKDCIHTIYRISKDGKILKEGRYAHKQTAKKYLNTKDNVVTELKTAEYKVESRKWNETTKKYITEYMIH